ncbi:MAG: hypothetical protein IPM16_12260 [Chloroflexi bacterium]|nr:hypothetical protein [Chloroflexota bacterium]
MPSVFTGEPIADLKRTIEEALDTTRSSQLDVLRLRYGLDAAPKLTFEDIATLRGLSRQRIQQLEATALEFLRALFRNGKRLETALSAPMEELVTDIKNHITALGLPIHEARLSTHLSDYLTVSDADRGYIHLLLEITGHSSFELMDGVTIWTQHQVDKAKLREIASQVTRFLQERVDPATWQDILLGISPRNRSRKHSPEDLKLVLGLIPAIEELDDGLFQIKFRKLRSVEDRVYRLVSSRAGNTPISIADITRIHNREASASGIKIHRQKIISAALSRDTRFQNIGKSGEWVLKKWAVSVESLLPIPELIDLILSRASGPLTADELHAAVSQSRSISKANLSAFISTNSDRFVRLKDGRISLRVSAPSREIAVRPIRNPAKTNSVEIALTVERVFRSTTREEMSVDEICSSISTLLPEANLTSIRRLVLKPNPSLQLHTNGENQHVTFVPDFRKRFSAIEIASEGRIGEYVTRTIRAILFQHDKLELMALRTLISIKCNLKPHNVYAYVRRMDDIKSFVDKDGKTYLALKQDIPTDLAEKARRIRTPEIASEVVEGLLNLTPQKVDWGLFSLGRAFDVCSKSLIVELARRGLIRNKNGLVSESDAESVTLATRIDLLVANKQLQDKNTLDSLRKVRNHPAHVISTPQQKQEMLIASITYAHWYIDYILLFESMLEPESVDQP